MTVKVAHKVILGFAVVLLLLFVASFSSIRLLGNIQYATSQVGDLAIPAQHFSNKIQIQLLKQAKLSALIESTANFTQLTTLNNKFIKEGEDLQQLVRGLKNILVEKTKTKAILSDFSLSYSKYQDVITQMFVQKEKILSAMAALNAKHEKLASDLDQTDIALVDLSYLEDEKKQAAIDKITSVSVQIEGYIINLTDSSKEIVALDKLAVVLDLKNTIEIGISNTDALLTFLKRLEKQHDTDGLIDTIIGNFSKVKQQLSGEQSLFAIKISQLEQQQQLSEHFIQSEKHVNQSITINEKLLNVFDNNLTQLQSNVFDSIEQGKNTSLTLLVIVIVASSIIAFATVRAMIIPLRRINKVLSYMAKGDLSRQLKVMNDDEYGELSKNVNLVVEDLRSLVGEISTNSHLLNVAAVKSSAEIEQVAESLQQQTTVEKVTTVTQELSQSADHVLDKATSSEQEMNRAFSLSNELESIAKTTNQRIVDLVNMLDNTSNLMAVLQKESTNIGGILETIQSISNQTNLLALNAAIEAARAGEARRGFAVVADEVRMLASRTHESTTEINDMIDSLQSKTAKAVSDIDDGKSAANNCQEHTDQLLETLLKINEAIEQMQRMSGDIAGSAKQQNSLSNEINLSIADVVVLSQQSSAKSHSTLTYSKQVADLAEKLDKSVDEFKM